jgi:hypothetical protein
VGPILVVANGYDAFAEAFRQKLTLEVAGRAPGQKLANASSAWQRARSPRD